MTQKFHENETATIALYKYHELLDCVERSAKFKRTVDWDLVSLIRATLTSMETTTLYLDGAGDDVPSIDGIKYYMNYLLNIVESMKF